jgi:4a-hydroxytetrahydrobiopterin dehydratase
MTQVTLYTKPNCHLCDEAKAAIRRSGVEVDLQEVDIESDADLLHRFRDDIPVIYVDGEEAFRHRVDPAAFAAYVRDGAPPRAAMPQNPLASEKCEPCHGGVPRVKGDELQRLAQLLADGWRVINEHHLEKEFRFPDFVQALAFTNRVGAIAEEQQHHPDIYLTWGKVRVTIWTHAIDGLSRNDFVLAAKIDGIRESR